MLREGSLWCLFSNFSLTFLMASSHTDSAEKWSVQRNTQPDFVRFFKGITDGKLLGWREWSCKALAIYAIIKQQMSCFHSGDSFLHVSLRPSTHVVLHCDAKWGGCLSCWRHWRHHCLLSSFLATCAKFVHSVEFLYLKLRACNCRRIWTSFLFYELAQMQAEVLNVQ